MRVYKLTDRDGYTRRGQSGETHWVPGEVHTAMGKGNELCSSAMIHAYRHPLLAALMNPIHAKIVNPLLWEVDTDAVVADDGCKIGAKSMSVVRAIPMPALTLEQSVTVAIRIALELTGNWDGRAAFAEWADGWISGKDRSWAAAEAARDAAEAAKAAAMAAREIGRAHV